MTVTAVRKDPHTLTMILEAEFDARRQGARLAAIYREIAERGATQ